MCRGLRICFVSRRLALWLSNVCTLRWFHISNDFQSFLTSGATFILPLRPGIYAMSSDEIIRPLTCLQGRLNLVDYRPQTRNIPALQDALLARTRNSIRHSPNNNDLLEYLGDRCVNLVIALFIDKVRLNRNHHMVCDVSVSSSTWAQIDVYG